MAIQKLKQPDLQHNEPQRFIDEAKEWLKANPDADPIDVEFYSRNIRFAEKCIRERKPFRAVGERPPWPFRGFQDGAISGLKGIPPDEAIRDIDDWREVWPDVAAKHKTTFDKLRAEAVDRLKPS